MSSIRILILVCALSILTSCGSNPEPEPRFSDQQTSYIQVGTPEDASYGNVHRVSARITVPLERSAEELRATLERAGRELLNESGADAVMVFAYRPGDPISGLYTAGRVVYAPGGQWESTESAAPLRFDVDLSDLYFDPTKSTLAVGQTVHLTASGSEVSVSNEQGRWSEDVIIAKVPVGTRAEIVAIHSQPLGGQEFVRYEVQLLEHDLEVRGWVHESAVKAP